MTPETKELLKVKGLKAAEDHIILGVDEAIEIGEIMVLDTESTLDDSALAIVKNFKGLLVEYIDKIDGIDNQG